jgi:dienelactone hydrolase
MSRTTRHTLVTVTDLLHGSASRPALRFSRFPSGRWLGALVLAGLLVADARAQSSLQMSMLRLRFAVAQRTTTVDESTKATVRELETAVRRENAAGQTGLVFRDLNKGIALLQGKPATATKEFTTSLFLTSDTVVCDPGQPLAVRITQYYPAQLDGLVKLSAEATLGMLAGPQSGARSRPGRPLGSFTGLASDLSLDPFRFTLNLAGVNDGNYVVQVTLRNGDSILHSLSLPVFLVRGWDTKRKAIETRLKDVHDFEQVKASIRYPFDFARTVNLGHLTAGNYNFAEGIAKSEGLLTAIEAGKDPFAGAVGMLQRHYFFAEADEIMPYRLYVPKNYDSTKPYPLIVALHGLGGTDASMLEGYGQTLPRLAEEHGYLVAAPMGYRRNGAYGRVNPNLKADAATVRMTQLSEQDVMNVLKLVRKQYKVAPSRIYLMGHSMGGYGTWNLGNKYAEIWAALAPIAGGNPPGLDLNHLKGVPIMIVHGDADHTVPVEASRDAVAGMKTLGIPYEYIEVPGGGHGDVVAPNLPKIIEFFDKYPRQPR